MICSRKVGGKARYNMQIPVREKFSRNFFYQILILFFPSANSSVEQRSPTIYLGGGHDFLSEIGLFRKLAGTELFASRVKSGSTIELGENVQLRSIVRAGDGKYFIFQLNFNAMQYFPKDAFLLFGMDMWGAIIDFFSSLGSQTTFWERLVRCSSYYAPSPMSGNLGEKKSIW